MVPAAISEGRTWRRVWEELGPERVGRVTARFYDRIGGPTVPLVFEPAVSEALAEGMTVVDYAPDAPVAEDYLNLATWLRTVAAPATAGFRNVRWSER